MDLSYEFVMDNANPSIRDAYQRLEELEAGKAQNLGELQQRQIKLSQELSDIKTIIRFTTKGKGQEQFKAIGERYAQEYELPERSDTLMAALENLKNGKSIGSGALTIGKESLRQIGDILRLTYDAYILYNKCVLQKRFYVFYHEEDPDKAGNYVKKYGAPAIPGIFVNANIKQPRAEVEILAVTQANENLRAYVKALRYKYDVISPGIQIFLKFTTWVAGILYISFTLAELDEKLLAIPYVLLAVGAIGMALVAAVVKEIQRHWRNQNSKLRLEYANLISKDNKAIELEEIKKDDVEAPSPKAALENKLWGHPYLFSGHVLFLNGLSLEQPNILKLNEELPYFLTARYLGVNKDFMTKTLSRWNKAKYESAINGWHSVVVKGREKSVT